MATINKIIIYNDTPQLLTNKTAVAAVLDTIKQKDKDNKYISPYLIKDVVVNVVENKSSTTFRAAKVAKVTKKK